MNRFLPHLVWLGGFVALIASCAMVIFTLKSHPDPAATQDTELREHLHAALVLGVVGSLVFFAGLVWAIGRWLKGFRNGNAGSF